MAPKVASKTAGADTPTSNAAGSSSGSNEGAADTRLRSNLNGERALRVPLSSLAASNIASCLFSAIPAFKKFVPVWNSSLFTGSYIASHTPSLFKTELSKLYSTTTMDDEIRGAVFDWIQSRVLAQVNQDAESVDADVASLWRTARLVAPAASLQFLGGGGQTTELGQFHGGGGQIPAFSGLLPPHTPQQFAFGRRDVPTPLSLAYTQQRYPAMFALSSAQTPFGQQPPAQTPHGQTLAQTPLGQQHPPAQTPFGQPPAQTPFGQQHPAQTPYGQTQQTAPLGQQFFAQTLYSQQQLQEQTPFGQPLYHQNSHNSALQLQQFHLQHQSIPLMPWEVEAANRGPLPVDPDMMPGFNRRSIAKIIQAAIVARQKNVAAGTPQVLERIKYPTMSNFTGHDYRATRTAFYTATRLSIPSCLFQEFKFCMTDTARSAATRRFGLTDELWLACDDSKLQDWMAILFGPKSKADALKLLKAVKFPDHRDVSDSQSTFLVKLDTCVFEFEMIVNDIADCHKTWVSDTTRCGGA
jgi:hypothetical protein